MKLSTKLWDSARTLFNEYSALQYSNMVKEVRDGTFKPDSLKLVNMQVLVQELIVAAVRAEELEKDET